MRFAIMMILMTLPFMLMAENGLSPLLNGINSNLYNNDQRAWRLTNIDAGSWQEIAFIFESRKEYSYWEEHPMATMQVQNSSYVGNQWRVDYRAEFSYEPNYEYIQQALLSNVDGDFLQPDKRFTFFYDDQNRLLGHNIDEYQSSTSSWTPYSRMHMLYNNELLVESIEWWGDEYVRFTIEYDDLGKVVEQTQYSSTDSLNWIPENRYHLSYNTNDTGTSTGYISYIAHALPLIYALDQFISYGMIDQTVVESWTGTTWALNFRRTNSYNTNNQVAECLEEIFNVSWENESKDIVTYDVNGNQEFRTSYGWDGDSWYNQNRDSYTWSQVTGNNDEAIATVHGLNVQAYPSPFMSNIRVNVSSKNQQPIHIEIYNIKGQCVLKNTIQPNQTVSMDVSKFSSGVYLLRASQETQTETVKIVRMK